MISYEYFILVVLLIFTLSGFAETTAFYAAGSHAIVVCPKFFDIGNGDQQTYILAHELVHSPGGCR